MASVAIFRRALPRAVMWKPPLTATCQHLSRMSSIPRVAENVVNMIVYDREGERRSVKGLAGQTIWKTLVRNGVEVWETHPTDDVVLSCNGNCEVTIANEWLEKVPPRSQDEVNILRSVSPKAEVNRHSRLGCQLKLSKDLEGMTFAKVELRPTYTP